jgi:hypothetical protein
MPLYYYDEQGYKIGPIKKKELFTLAESGAIAPETRLTDGTNETKAKHVSGLKFIAAEYHRAEEIFDPENINFNEIPSIPYTTSTNTGYNQAYNEKKKSIDTPVITKIEKRIENITQVIIPQQTGYWYFRFTVKTYYIIASCLFYGGLSITALIALASLTESAIYFPIILICGSIISIILSMGFGFIADITQWLINTESHLQQIKSRLNQNDSDG